jgi:hypothetical protein
MASALNVAKKQWILSRKENLVIDFDLFDWMVIGPLSEELAEDERDRRRLEDDLDQEDDEEPW